MDHPGAITNPPDNSKTGTALLNVNGTVDETSTVTVVTGMGIQTASMNGKSFNIDTALSPGYNTIEITATDMAGNKSTQKRTIVYDDQKPSMAVTLPAQDIRTNLSGLTIQGVVFDPYTAVTVSIAMDGQTFTPQVIIF